MATPDAILVARGVEAGYAKKQILFGLDFSVSRSEVVALLGANGSGKSTALNTVSGFVRPQAGSIRFEGAEIAGKAPHRIFRLGVVQVSQARDLFSEMSVEENLRLGAWVRGGEVARLLDGVYQSFPRLAERRRQMVRLMSGGEQQMVAIGRALMADPRILLLDEPSGGLAPSFVAEIAAIIKALKARGIAMLIIEQNIKLALSVADRFLILRDGRVSQQHDVKAGMREEEIVRRIYL
ncbi:MAG: ABC transporter ATP-binding protein [Alphaproteobacteria bacterium]|nr:ABC transporter ATP-binding protein [Alphaproteobacteria bacterium]